MKKNDIYVAKWADSCWDWVRVPFDAVTDLDCKLAVDEVVEIVSTENECAVVRRVSLAEKSDDK